MSQSSLTSLGVNKSSTRFTPKVKARPSRRPQEQKATVSQEIIDADHPSDQTASSQKAHPLPNIFPSTQDTVSSSTASSIPTIATTGSAPSLASRVNSSTSSIAVPSKQPPSSRGTSIVPGSSTQASPTIASSAPSVSTTSSSSSKSIPTLKTPSSAKVGQSKVMELKRLVEKTASASIAISAPGRGKEKATSIQPGAPAHSSADTATSVPTVTNSIKAFTIPMVASSPTKPNVQATSSTSTAKSPAYTPGKATTPRTKAAQSPTTIAKRKGKEKETAHADSVAHQLRQKRQRVDTKPALDDVSGDQEMNEELDHSSDEDFVLDGRRRSVSQADGLDEVASTTSTPVKSRKKRVWLAKDMKTLDDIDYDPLVTEDLDRPVAYFLEDLDQGIVSKIYREKCLARDEQRMNMSAEAYEETKRMKTEVEHREKVEAEAAAEREHERQRLLESDASGLVESSNALQVRLVNGEIMLDTDSMLIDRGGQRSTMTHEDMEVVEENAHSRKINSATYGKSTRSAKWSVEETDLFYDYLSEFGTDFEMMSKVMPARTRSQLRMKFNREERLHPKRITEYLIYKKKPMNLERFKNITGQEFEPVPHDFHSTPT
ncbi:hypothetical protein DM01DRAFT_1335069 [Hesseltinella vesiculosa]|uniref:Myb-like domain-containing protein n=1 Tax=Hesseltinella vesiculosa TaxID=101127 RepID=A0A1X2GK95_9FUNG|nr:hypothetical protein DM01DRAFT_1335069 [Hesseltinella vesiculosa]